MSLTTDTEPAWAATASSKMADQPLPTDGTALHQIHSIRVRAVWTLLAGAVLSAIGVGTLSYANSAGGLVWGGAVLAGGLMIFRAARSLRRLRTRWAIPSVVAILVVVVVVGVEASNAGTSAADHRANDLVGHYLRHSDSTLYRETDLAQQLTAICEIADNMGGGVLVKNVAGDYGITEPAGASHEPPGTPGCAATAPMLDEAQTLINLIHGN